MTYPKNPKLAIVGSRELDGSLEAYEIIEQVLAILDPSEVISGGARGIDSMAIKLAREAGIKTLEFFPTESNWRGYKARNAKIARACDCLVRIASASSRTYGSGWTRDEARRLGKDTWECVVPVARFKAVVRRNLGPRK